MARKKSLWRHKNSIGALFDSEYSFNHLNKKRELVLIDREKNPRNIVTFLSHEKAKEAGWEILKQKN